MNLFKGKNMSAGQALWNGTTGEFYTEITSSQQLISAAGKYLYQQTDFSIFSAEPWYPAIKAGIFRTIEIGAEKYAGQR